MSDSIGRLYQAVLAARDLDPAPVAHGQAVPARHGQDGQEAGRRGHRGRDRRGERRCPGRGARERRPDLQSDGALGRAGVRPEDVWREMERRELLLGIAEKLPKSPVEAAEDAADAAGSGDQLSRSRAAACASGASSPKRLSRAMDKSAAGCFIAPCSDGSMTGVSTPRTSRMPFGSWPRSPSPKAPFFRCRRT